MNLKRESYKWWKAFYRMGKLDCPDACPLPVSEEEFHAARVYNDSTASADYDVEQRNAVVPYFL